MSTKRKLSTVKFQIGRDSATGRFIPLAVAKRRRKSAVVETIKQKR